MPEDIDFLSARLRKEDIAELDAAGYLSASSALLQGYVISDLCFTGLDPETGEPALMFGVVRTEEDIGFNTVWLLGSDAITRHGKRFARYSRHWIKTLAETYGAIGNTVDLRNVFYLRWLLWCGFRRVTTVKTNDIPFGLFVLECGRKEARPCVRP